MKQSIQTPPKESNKYFSSPAIASIVTTPFSFSSRYTKWSFLCPNDELFSLALIIYRNLTRRTAFFRRIAYLASQAKGYRYETVQ